MDRNLDFYEKYFSQNINQKHYTDNLRKFLRKEHGYNITDYLSWSDIARDDFDWWYTFITGDSYHLDVDFFLIHNKAMFGILDDEYLFKITDSSWDDIWEQHNDQNLDYWLGYVDVISETTGHEYNICWVELVPLIKSLIPEEKDCKVWPDEEKTSCGSRITEDGCDKYVKLKKQIFEDKTGDYVNKTNPSKPVKVKEKDMSVKALASTMVDKNKEAAKLAAKIEVGSAATSIVVSKLAPQLPEALKPYASHPLFAVAVANATAGSIKHFAADNEKANILADAMIQSAMIDFVKGFNISSLIQELVDSVSIKKLIPSSSMEGE